MTDEAVTLERTDLNAVLLPGRGTKGGYSLVVDGTTQSHVNPDDPLDLQLPYIRTLAAVIDSAFPGTGAISALHLGGGALTVPRYLAETRPGSVQRVVELHGPLLEFVLTHLPLAAGCDPDLVIDDARAHVEGVAASEERWQLVVVDVYSASVAPPSVSTLDFYEFIARALTPDGVVIVNAFAAAGLGFTHDVAAVLTSAFPHVLAVAPAAVLAGERVGNVILAASRHPIATAGLLASVPDPAGARLVEGDALRAFAESGVLRRDPQGVQAG